MLQDDAQKANAPTVLAPKQLPAHRHRHAGEMAPRGYPEGCVAHSSVPCQRNTRGAEQAQASSPDKNHVTSKSPVGDISVVTLIRTDTTLDHSQKAEKVWLMSAHATDDLQFARIICVKNQIVSRSVFAVSAS